MANDDILKELNNQKKLLQGFKQTAEGIKTERIVNETNLKNLEKNEKAIMDKCRALGYDPDKLRDIIAEKMDNLKKITGKLDKLMPSGDGKLPADVNDILASLKDTSIVAQEQAVPVTNNIDIDKNLLPTDDDLGLGDIEL
jgi:uncharacterized protein (UPF0335 family)